MKQSQNAITFLRAQYSAVYGRAYIKGLASAMVVTSALVGAYSQEANAVEEVPASKDWDNAEDYTTGGDSGTYNLGNKGYYDNLTVVSGDKVQIRDINLKGTLTINQGGTASFTSQEDQGRDLYGWDYFNDGFAGASKATGSLENKGTLNVGGEGLTDGSQFYFNKVDLNSGSSTFVRGDVNSGTAIDKYSSLAGGYGSEGGVALQKGANLFLKNNAQLKVAQGSTGSFDGQVFLNSNKSGSNSFIRGEDNYIITNGSGSWSGDAAKLVFDDSSRIFVSHTDTSGIDLKEYGIAGIYAANTELNGRVYVGISGDNTTLVLDGDFIDTNTSVSDAKHGAGNFVAGANARIVIGNNSRLIVGDGAYADDPETKDVDESQLKTSLDLTNLKQDNLSGEGILEVRGSLALTESVLNGFVKPSAVSNDASGGIVSLSGGVLNLKSDDEAKGIDLSKYKFFNDEGSTVDISVTGDNSTIKADKLLVSTNIGSNCLNIEADSLTLGWKDPKDGFVFKRFVAHDEVKFVDLIGTNNQLKLSKNLLINAVGNNNTILGRDSAISSGDVNVGALYHVVGGAVTHQGQLMVLAAGQLKVGGATADNNDKVISSAFGHDASLTLGASDSFKISSSSLNIDGNGAGATSRVDISKVNNVSFSVSKDEVKTTKINIGINKNAAKLSDAIFKINDQHLGKLFPSTITRGLRNGQNGSKLVIGQNGTLEIVDNDPTMFTYKGISASYASPDQVLLDVSLLCNGNTDTTENNFIYFKNGGRVETDKLQLTQADTANNGVLDIGQGTVAAKELQIRNAIKTDDKDKLVVRNGVLEVGKELSGFGKTTNLVLGDAGTDSASGGAHLNLGKIAYTANADATGLHDGKYTYDASNSSSGGTINTAVVLNGSTKDDATLNVRKGSWKVGDSGSIGFGESGHGTINVGVAADEILDPDLDLAALKAELQLDNPDGMTVTSGNGFNVRDTGAASFTKFVVEDGASSIVDGTLTAHEADLSAAGVDFTGHGRLNIVGATDADGNVLSGALSISQANLGKFLSPADANAPDTHGTLLFKDDGTLNFSDSTQINIGAYSFAQQANDTDPLTADVNLAKDKHLEVKAQNLLIDKSLAANPVSLSTSSTDLTLGGGAGFVSQDQALGVESLNTQNVTFNDDETGDAFSLRDTLNLRGQSADPSDPTQALKGTSTGNVKLAQSGSYNLQEGEYTHSGNMTLNGGSLTVGDTANLSGDAHLIVSGDFAIDNSNGASNITIKGNGFGGTSTLDLTQASNVAVTHDATGSGFTYFDVGDVGTDVNANLKLNSDQLTNLLGSGAAGVLLHGSGQVEVSGDATLNGIVFASDSTAQPDKIVFDNGGKVAIDGQATFTGSQGQAMAFGSGTVSVSNGLNLSGSDVTLAQGILDVSSKGNPLLSGDGSFSVGDGSTSGDAIVNFHANTTDTSANVLNSSLSLNGAGDNHAQVSFDQGNFTAQNITIKGNQNVIVLGDDNTSTPVVNLVGTDLTVADSGAFTLKGSDSDSSGHSATFDNVTLGEDATLTLGVDTFTISGGSGDFSKGTLAGTANLKVVGSEASASLKGDNFNDLLSGGASISLQSGADLDLQSDDFIDITKFAYDTDPAGTGAIHVIDSTGDHISQITGNKLTVSQKLNPAGNPIELGVSATDLTLGGGSGFDSSTDALGLHELNAQNVTFNNDADTVNAFTLHDKLNLFAPQSDTGVNGSGSSTGNLHIADGGFYHVHEGQYTHSGNMTLNGGTLRIGGTDNLSGDAILSVDGDFTIDNTGSSQGSLIIKGNGQGGKSTLDLSSATNIAVKGNGTTFTSLEIGDSATATASDSNAALKLKGEQLTSILGMSNTGILLNASGEIDASSTGTLTLNGDQLQAGTDAVAGKLTFNDGGRLRTDVLELSGSTVNIGLGTIESNHLKLNQTNLGSGTFHVVNQLEVDSSQDIVELNDGTNLTLGRFVLDKSNVDHADAVDRDSLGGNPGSIGASLSLNSGSKLNIIQGAWSLKDGSGDLSVASGATVTIGAVDGNAYQIYDDKGSGSPVTASLSGGTLTLDGGELTINNSGQADFEILDTSNSNATINVNNGTLNISQEVHLKSGDVITITGAGKEGSSGVVHFADKAAHKITANTDGTSLHVESGSFAKVFDLVSGGHLKLDLGDQVFTLEQIKELRKTLIVGNVDGSVMDPSARGFIHLGDAQIAGIGGGGGFNEIPFNQYNPTTGEITSGMGGSGITNGNTVLALSAQNRDILADLADIQDFRSDVGDDILLYDVTRDRAVVGNIGAMRMADGTSSNALIGDSVTLSHAYASNGGTDRQFIFANDGAVRGADIQSGGALYLENGGYIGEINLADGTRDKSTTLTVNKRDASKPYGSGDDGITYIESISGGADTYFSNNDVTHVADGITIADLSNTSELYVDSGDLVVTRGIELAPNSITEVSGDARLNNLVQEDKASLKATNITFSNNATLRGQTTASGKVSTNMIDTSSGEFTLDSGASLSANEADLKAKQLTLNGTVDLASSGNFTGNVINLGSGSNITIKSGNLNFIASGATGSFVQQAGSETSGTDLNIKADHDVTLAGINTFTGKGTVTAGGDLSIGGTQQFKESATFVGQNITFATGSSITTDGDLSFTVKEDFIQDDNVSLSGANLNISAGKNLSLANNDFAGSGTFTAGDNLYIDGKQSFGSGATFTGNVITIASGAGVNSSGDVLFNASGATGSFVQAAGSNLSGSNITFTGNKFDASGTITADQDILVGSKLASGTTGASGEFNLGYQGSMKAGRDIYLNAATHNINGIVAADTGTLYVNGSQNTFGNRSQVMAQSVVFQGNTVFAGSGKFSQNLDNSGSLTIDGSVTTGALNNHGRLSIHGYLGVNRAELNQNSSMAIDGESKIGTLTAQDASSTIAVGGDSGNLGSGSSSLQVDSLNLNGSKLVVSTNYDNHVALLAITGTSGSNVVTANIADGVSKAKMASAQVVAAVVPTATTISNGNQLDGDLIIGKNSAVAWGSDLATLQQDIEMYKNSRGALGENSDKFGTILVINQPLKISEGSRVVLDHNADAVADANKGSVGDVYDLAAQDTGSGVTGADLSMTEHSTILLKVDNLKEGQGAAIQFAKDDAKVSAESGATIVLDGNYSARKAIDIFSDGDDSGVELIGSKVRVQNKSGLFVGELGTGNDVSSLFLRLNEDVKNDLPISDEMKDLIDSYNPDSNSGFSGDNSYLDSAINNDPLALDAAARFDVFGGVAQATKAVSDYMTDTMLARVGIGSTGADFSNIGGGHGNAQMWVNPIYVHQNNKGFETSGLKYGSNLNLYGMNAGVEVALTPLLKAGAMVNFGTGSSKGKEFADGVKNDFDYLGAGAYVATKLDNFTLLGDVSYNKVSHDLEDINSIDKLTSSFDSTNLSIGLMGKLDLQAHGFNISPYAGIRYQHFKWDDYDLKGETHGNFVHKDNSSMDIWELPVGVAVSKTFVTESGWMFKPSVDLHLKANFGDDKLEGNVAWKNTNAVSHVTSEVFDPFSYGVDAAIKMKKGNFNMGAGVGYTGSANTNEFAVQANFSYNF